MKIHVIGNCHTDQVVTGLRALLGSTAEVSGKRYGPVDFAGTDDQAAAMEAAGADAVLTNLNPARYEQWISRDRIHAFPNLYFCGFHPDQTGLALKGSPHQKLKGTLRDGDRIVARLVVSAAIGAWALKKRLSVTDTVKLYRTDVFRDLGYLDAFTWSVTALRQSFAAAGLDFTPMLRVIHTRSVFMWGAEHPKMSLVLALCESIIAKLGLKPQARAEDMAELLLDPLEPEYAFGCYPPVANHLGVPGSWSMRIDKIIHPDLTSYMTELFLLLGRFPADDIQILERDAAIFRLPEMGKVLEGYV